MKLRCRSRTLDLSTPVVMGVLNVTPDSFSDGGRFFDPGRAVEHALAMIESGAAIIDVGGESTRPGADNVDADEELRRVIPVVDALSRSTTAIISVDTSKPEVMAAAIAAGAQLVNDVYALRAPGAIAAVRGSGAAVCLMHMQGEPRTMQTAPHYHDVVGEVRDFLADRVTACRTAGIAAECIVVDPGIGFGKRLEHNLALLANLPALAELDAPVLVGVSRKSMFGALLARPVEERMAGGLACATAAVLAGARIVRAHDVRETADAIKVAEALRTAGYRIL